MWNRVTDCSFGMFDEKEISKLSSVCINKDRGIDYVTGLPQQGGLYDPRLGTLDINQMYTNHSFLGFIFFFL